MKESSLTDSGSQVGSEIGPAVSAKQSDNMLHALGHSRPERPLGWRNSFCVADGDPDCEYLVSIGMMHTGPTINNGRDRYYGVSRLGKEYLTKTFGVEIVPGPRMVPRSEPAQAPNPTTVSQSTQEKEI